jgi:hypothetical protein
MLPKHQKIKIEAHALPNFTIELSLLEIEMSIVYQENLNLTILF